MSLIFRGLLILIGAAQIVSPSDYYKDVVENLTKEWAPIVWLAPEEKFMPLGVDEFLKNVHSDPLPTPTAGIDMPTGANSLKSFLVTNTDVDNLLEDEKSFIYGKSPMDDTVPVYAVVSECDSLPVAHSSVNFKQGKYIPLCLNASDCKKDSDLNKIDRHPFGSTPKFHVTYWMFYPYNQGKQMCTLDLGLFGSIPFPDMFGYCLGSRRDIGSHVGDWEHMTLSFNGKLYPEQMYVSAHDAGAYYRYNNLTQLFEFQRQETRKGILQRPNFPKTVTTSDKHPILFAAKGSHGLWAAPGKHRFVKVARLYDINGYGTPWNTWKALHISYQSSRIDGQVAPQWLFYKGKWGNPKSNCHPLRRLGINFCEFIDGPTGIPLKEPHFHCDS